MTEKENKKEKIEYNIEKLSKRYLIEYGGEDYSDKINLDFCNTIQRMIKDEDYDCTELKIYMAENGYIELIDNNVVSLTMKGMSFCSSFQNKNL